MKILRVSRSTLAKAVFSAALSLAIFGCNPKQPTGKGYCRDRKTYVDKDTGVKDQTVAVCPGYKMRWLDNGEDWEVEFKGDSPFDSKSKRVKKGDPDSVARKDLTQDTAFPYTITVNVKKFDPEIIVMGGDN